jgi:hypothetical protein
MATGIGVAVAIAVILVLSGFKDPERVRALAWGACYHTALGCIHGSVVRLLLQREALPRLCDPGSIPPMLTGRGPNGRLRVLYATIVLPRLVNPNQRKIVGCSNRAQNEQAPSE